MTRNLLIKFAVCMLASSFGATELWAEQKNGEANTSERQAYCKYKLKKCQDDVYHDCGEPDKGAGASADTNSCRTSELRTCESSYGTTSDCLTRIETVGAMWEAERFDTAGDVLSAPEETKQPLRASLQLDAATSGRVVSRDELAVNLKAGQKLLLTNGSHISMADGSVHVIEMNGRTTQSYPGARIVKDSGGKISVLSGGKRFEAGIFKAIESPANQRERRKTRDHR